ncbi:hypothetical protein V1639_04435 [Pseudarthrobacter sp. J75]|uniref:hypothetical protein n=1 Tax=unclassified Pseudarthrobacter TaxID=2647000 RepID=UPI002E81610D|nr:MULTISPECIES: hypothetical protein [unclassified Pseudarthrobacter]MEE2523951.1 hypothetical protein [Pseudarthrobacter sp. J47]MEE2528281.1 hypothetical protein [Pseudarthrobacter sp. J75]MEE2567983.1 hypothetical protein [Pseudarthrobacter sp. J64]
MTNPATTNNPGSIATGSLFGWAFGDEARRGDAAYVKELKDQALENARATASAKGVEILSRSAAYTVVCAHDTILELDNAPDSLIVRCTVKVVGPGAEKLHAEGPMNG